MVVTLPVMLVVEILLTTVFWASAVAALVLALRAVTDALAALFIALTAIVASLLKFLA